MSHDCNWKFISGFACVCFLFKFTANMDQTKIHRIVSIDIWPIVNWYTSFFLPMITILDRIIHELIGQFFGAMTLFF